MTELFLVALFTLLGVIAQTIVGFGVAAFLLPILFILFDPATAITIILFIANILCLLVLFNERKTSKLVWSVVIRLFVSSLPGIVLGAYIVTHGDKGALLVAIGVLIAVSLMIQEYLFPTPKRLFKVSPSIHASGFVAGLLTSAATTAPAPLVMWMRAHNATPNQTRHNLAAIFLFMNCASIPAIYLFQRSSLRLEGLIVAGWMIPVVIIGYTLGRVLSKRVNAKLYHKLVLAAVMLSAIVCVALGIQILI